MVLAKKVLFTSSGARDLVAATPAFFEIAQVRISQAGFHFDRIVRFRMAENSSTWRKKYPSRPTYPNTHFRLEGVGNPQH